MKIHHDLDNEALESDPLAEVYRDTELWEVLRRRGYHRVDTPREADVSLRMAHTIGRAEHPVTIALERIDSCQLRYPHLFSDPNVRRVVKMYRYADERVYSFACTDGRVFTRFLGDDHDHAAREVPEGTAEKLALGLSFLHYKRHARHAEAARQAQPDTRRAHDVFFAGTTRYAESSTGEMLKTQESGALISGHRGSLVATLERLSGPDIVVAPNKAFCGREYMSLMQSTKLVVSPWGWGEACYRDYEAILHGAEVIKPATYEMRTNPDIYNEDFMTFCDPSWCDLEATIESRLARWSEGEADRRRRRDALLEAIGIEHRADLVTAVLDDALDSHR